DALPHVYHKADIFVMPSLSEGFGTVALEAMAAGLAVVATRVGGLADIIEDEKTGIFAEPRNSGDLFRAVLRLFKDKSLRVLLAERAQKKVLDFDWKESAKKVSDLYRAAVSSKIHALR
ncbi:MAG: glycosyltransferase family 4 protein, partial [Candidatus Spechtbacteria bacterium]|nr:glycosyltransferase family 4 protein [Candidatus Spechtbacteria bacterium]